MKLDLIGLTVKDIAASVDFYRHLGLTIPVPPAGEDHFEITLANGLRIAWDTEALISQIDSHWVPPVGQRMSMAFLCDSPEEVNAKYAEVVAAGYPSRSEPWDAFWGQRYAQVQDPDGNTVDLFAPLPTPPAHTP